MKKNNNITQPQPPPILSKSDSFAIEINRSRRYIAHIESQMTPVQLEQAQAEFNAKMSRSRARNNMGAATAAAASSPNKKT
jgi:hypothetical protein